MFTSCPHCGAAMDDGSRFCSVCGRPIPAMQEEATVFVLKPGTACLEETDECISPPAASPPALSRREKRIARKLRHMAFLGSGRRVVCASNRGAGRFYSHRSRL